jgi:hypothetical protein
MSLTFPLITRRRALAYLSAASAAALGGLPRAAAPATPAPVLPPLSEGQKRILTGYLSALQHANYGVAFGMLSKGEQAYFENVANFTSIFTADRLTLNRFAIAGAVAKRGGDAVALVNQNVTVLDPAHQNLVTANASVRYGIVAEAGTLRIRDLFHPWKSFVPQGATGAKDRLSVTVRKVSLFPDRIELIVTFANTGESSATVFAYGRSVLHADGDRVYPLVARALAARIDNELYLGLRLPISGQYTGIVAFKTPDAHASPRRLSLSVAPIVREGAEEPLAIDVPPFDVPA